MASLREVQVTFDCAEPERVGRFWCEVLGYVVPPPPPGFASWDEFDRSLPADRQGSAFACVDPTGAGPRLFFQRVPEGKTVKNRLHLDLEPVEGARDDELARLLGHGAVEVEDHRGQYGPGTGWVVLADPEGNEFCILRNLAEREGAASADGTVEGS